MTEREAFEAWFYASKYAQVTIPSKGDVQRGWDTWQACAALKDKRIAELAQELAAIRQQCADEDTRILTMTELDDARKQVAELTAERESAYNAACSKWVKRHDELTAERDALLEWQAKAFLAHANIDLDVNAIDEAMKNT